MFPGRLISRFGDIPWTARSPDLTVPGISLWEYLKSEVHAARFLYTQEMKNRIMEGL
jgi:hypothetical protein